MFGIFGNITNPFPTLGTTGYGGTQGQGLIIIISNLVKLAIIIAGLYALINFILAGYGFLSAGGDTKQVQKSTERIWRSVLGLVIVAGSFVLVMLFSYFIFGNATVITSPHIYPP
jgi:hypothetical protein